MKKTYNIVLTVERPCELLEFLYNNLSFPKKKVKSLLEHSAIVVDGIIRTKYNYKLSKGQKILIDDCGRYAFLREHKMVVLYEDNDILVVDKPCGLLSVATDAKEENTAYRILTEYVRLSNAKNRIFIVHRLDKETSGVFLVAKSEQFKLLLQNDWNNLVQARCYYALAEGVFDVKQGRVVAFLKQDKNHMVYSAASGEKAITEYTVIKESEQYSLLDVAIKTGKKNQIRVCMKDLNHTIIGDKKYGSKVNPMKRMGLHAYKLSLIHPITKELLTFETPIPKEFERCMR